VHRTSIDGTAINIESVGSIDGLAYVESVKPFGECVYLHVQLSFSFQLMVASLYAKSPVKLKNAPPFIDSIMLRLG
jgi:hypothetical protein